MWKWLVHSLAEWFDTEHRHKQQQQQLQNNIEVYRHPYALYIQNGQNSGDNIKTQRNTKWQQQQQQ